MHNISTPSDDGDSSDVNAKQREEVARLGDDQIIKNVDGTVYNPFTPSNGYVFTFNCFCCIIGLLASARVVYKSVVTCNGSGWRPRHVLLLGTIISCILTVLVHCFIPLIYFLWPNGGLCRFFVAVYRLPYVAFLFNIFLALIDRYVAVTRSTWHRTEITRKHCLIWLSLFNLLLAMAVKWSFIAQVDSVECAFHFKHGVTLVAIILVLFVLCTVFLIAVFVATWRQLPRAARTIPIPTLPPTPVALPFKILIDNQQPPPPINPAEIEYVPLRDLLPPTSAAVSVTEEETQPSSSQGTVNASEATLHKMELKVTKYFLFTLLPLFLIVIPCLIFGIFFLLTLYFNPLYSNLAGLVSYIHLFSLLPSLHVVIYPLANLFLNKEISFSFCCCHIPSLFCHPTPQQQLNDSNQDLICVLSPL